MTHKTTQQTDYTRLMPLFPAAEMSDKEKKHKCGNATLQEREHTLHIVIYLENKTLADKS